MVGLGHAGAGLHERLRTARFQADERVTRTAAVERGEEILRIGAVVTDVPQEMESIEHAGIRFDLQLHRGGVLAGQQIRGQLDPVAGAGLGTAGKGEGIIGPKRVGGVLYFGRAKRSVRRTVGHGLAVTWLRGEVVGGDEIIGRNGIGRDRRGRTDSHAGKRHRHCQHHTEQALAYRWFGCHCFSFLRAVILLAVQQI